MTNYKMSLQYVSGWNDQLLSSVGLMEMSEAYWNVSESQRLILEYPMLVWGWKKGNPTDPHSKHFTVKYHRFGEKLTDQICEDYIS